MQDTRDHIWKIPKMAWWKNLFCIFEDKSREFSKPVHLELLSSIEKLTKVQRTNEFRGIIILRVPVSSTHTPSVQQIGSTQGPPLFSTQIPQFNNKITQFHPPLSSTPKAPSSRPKPLQFLIKNPSVPHQKPLSSTNSSVPHLKPSVQHRKHLSSTHPLVWNWGVCETKGFPVWNWGVCWTEGFSVLSRGVFGVELRDFGGWKGVALLCGIDVLNWGGPWFC